MASLKPDKRWGTQTGSCLVPVNPQPAWPGRTRLQALSGVLQNGGGGAVEGLGALGRGPGGRLRPASTNPRAPEVRSRAPAAAPTCRLPASVFPAAFDSCLVPIPRATPGSTPATARRAVMPETSRSTACWAWRPSSAVRTDCWRRCADTSERRPSASAQLHRLGKPADPEEVRLHEVDQAFLHRPHPGPARRPVLSGGKGLPWNAPAHGFQSLPVVRDQHLLHPPHPVGAQGFAHLHGVIGVVRHPAVEHQVRVRTDLLAGPGDQLDGAVDAGLPVVDAIRPRQLEFF